LSGSVKLEFKFEPPLQNHTSATVLQKLIMTTDLF